MPVRLLLAFSTNHANTLQKPRALQSDLYGPKRVPQRPQSHAGASAS
jgi:hypothetical protein